MQLADRHAVSVEGNELKFIAGDLHQSPVIILLLSFGEIEKIVWRMISLR